MISDKKKEKPSKPSTQKSLSSKNDRSKYFGSLKGVFGDALTYQKKVRNEWK